MTTIAAREALALLRESLNELEKSNSTVAPSIRKLLRASKLVSNDRIRVWCEIELGNPVYCDALVAFYKALKEYKDKADESSLKAFRDANALTEKLGITDEHMDGSALMLKFSESSGGFDGVGTAEEHYARLQKAKKGNDGTYYIFNLNKAIEEARRRAHAYASEMYASLVVTDSPQSAVDILKKHVDDRLLDLEPNIAEMLMVAFRRSNSDNPEEWSQALTSCRRAIEATADKLFPPREESKSGRPLGATNYLNRLWAFMDSAIESQSTRDVAKAHVDILGKYLETNIKKTNKGIHATLTRLEAVKTVLHTYLAIGDVVDYWEEPSRPVQRGLNIHAASIEEMVRVGGIKKDAAKEVIRLRAENQVLDIKMLLQVKGIGPAAIAKIREKFSFEPLAPSEAE